MNRNGGNRLFDALISAGVEATDEPIVVPADARRVEVPSGAIAYNWTEPTPDKCGARVAFRSSPRLSGVRRRTHGTRRRAGNPVRRRKSSSTSRGDPDLADPEPPGVAPEGAGLHLGRIDRSRLLWRVRAARCRWHEWREGWPE